MTASKETSSCFVLHLSIVGVSVVGSRLVPQFVADAPEEFAGCEVVDGEAEK